MTLQADRLKRINPSMTVAINVKANALKAQGKNVLVMCYPYGGHTTNVTTLIEKMGFKLGLTTNFGDAKLLRSNAFTLERFDTNDFPK